MCFQAVESLFATILCRIANDSETVGILYHMKIWEIRRIEVLTGASHDCGVLDPLYAHINESILH